MFVYTTGGQEEKMCYLWCSVYPFSDMVPLLASHGVFPGMAEDAF